MTGMQDAPGEEPLRADVDQSRGWLLLQFGATWCGHCQAAQPVVQGFLQQHPDLAQRWVEDGKGRPLGSSYAVKLWPTLVLLRDGVEMARVVRPRGSADLQPLTVAMGDGRA